MAREDDDERVGVAVVDVDDVDVAEEVAAAGVVEGGQPAGGGGAAADARVEAAAGPAAVVQLEHQRHLRGAIAMPFKTDRNWKCDGILASPRRPDRGSSTRARALRRRSGNLRLKKITAYSSRVTFSTVNRMCSICIVDQCSRLHIKRLRPQMHATYRRANYSCSREKVPL